MVLGTEFGSTEFCRRLANTVRNVCQGEVAQSSRLYDLSMTREEYFEIIRKKTASLFSAATGGAGWISGVTPEVEESLYQLGDLLGVAYQIYDDCLDMVGDEDDAGKTLHTDATKGKLTLPSSICWNAVTGMWKLPCGTPLKTVKWLITPPFRIIPFLQRLWTRRFR